MRYDATQLYAVVDQAGIPLFVGKANSREKPPTSKFDPERTSPRIAAKGICALWIEKQTVCQEGLNSVSSCVNRVIKVAGTDTEGRSCFTIC
jgi:hypothetical protein